MKLQKTTVQEPGVPPSLVSLVTWPALVTRHLTIVGRRRSVCMEAEIWDSLEEIAQRESRSVADICTQVASERVGGMPLSSALRTYALNYFRFAAPR